MASTNVKASLPPGWSGLVVYLTVMTLIGLATAWMGTTLLRESESPEAQTRMQRVLALREISQQTVGSPEVAGKVLGQIGLVMVGAGLTMAAVFGLAAMVPLRPATHTLHIVLIAFGLPLVLPIWLLRRWDSDEVRDFYRREPTPPKADE